MKLKQRMREKTAQDRQDEIFRKMPADKKLKVASDLWLLAKELAGDKINYGTNRPKAPSHKSR
ncbi:MAG: hypothetical protein V1877_00570 [Candidatus Tagabacteria bacterium]